MTPSFNVVCSICEVSQNCNECDNVTREQKRTSKRKLVQTEKKESGKSKCQRQNH